MFVRTSVEPLGGGLEPGLQATEELGLTEGRLTFPSRGPVVGLLLGPLLLQSLDLFTERGQPLFLNSQADSFNLPPGFLLPVQEPLAVPQSRFDVDGQATLPEVQQRPLEGL